MSSILTGIGGGDRKGQSAGEMQFKIRDFTAAPGFNVLFREIAHF